MENQLKELSDRLYECYLRGEHDEGIRWGLQALAWAEQHLQPGDSSLGGILSDTGGLYHASGRYAEAESFYLRSVEILRKAPPPNDPIAITLGNLATLYQSMGDLDRAEPLFREALAIKRAAFGAYHPSCVTTLCDLATLCRTKGDDAAAVRFSRQARQVADDGLPDDDPRAAEALNSLGELYYWIGDLRQAERLYRQALGIWHSLQSEAAGAYANCLNNLGLLCRAAARFTEAAHYLEQAAASRRAAGDEGVNYALAIHNLGALFLDANLVDEAESRFRVTVDILRRTKGKGHSHYPAALNNLASVYRARGQFGDAEQLYREALDLWRARRSESHRREVAIALDNLATVVLPQGRVDEALTQACQARIVEQDSITQVFAIGSESQRAAYLIKIRRNLDTFLSLIRHAEASSPEAVRDGLDVVLQRKAILTEALAVQREVVLGGQRPELRPRLQRLATLRMQIAQKTLNGPEGEDQDGYDQRLRDWAAERDRLEADLTSAIPEMSLQHRLQAANRRAIALALPAGVTLVEFVRFKVYDFNAVTARGESPWQPARYLAFVLPAGEPDSVKMIDLGEADQIDRMIGDFRADITGEGEEREGPHLGTAQDELVRSRDLGPGTTLRSAVFDKLVPFLADCKRLLLATDGDLTRVPFEVLPTADGRCVIEDYAVSYVSCGRDVLRFGLEASNESTAPVVIGDPDFDLGTGHDDVTSDDRTHQVLSPLDLAQPVNASRHYLDLDRRHLCFGRLPGTRAESERIAAMLGVRPWLDAAALEGCVKKRRSPRILHLATHGFFLENQERDPNEELRDLGCVGLAGGDRSGRLWGANLENPMLRSGLALAGVNHWLNGGSPSAEAEDGLLTAEDVSGLDLMDTSLVVLSACETGLGQIHVGEGVFGLRRAFVLAGASTLVMSLWKVPDLQTQELMEDFYRRVLGGRGRAAALREAQLALRARYPDPRHWGAFICQGEPGPLRATNRNR